MEGERGGGSAHEAIRPIRSGGVTCMIRGRLRLPRRQPASHLSGRLSGEPLSLPAAPGSKHSLRASDFSCAHPFFPVRTCRPRPLSASGSPPAIPCGFPPLRRAGISAKPSVVRLWTCELPAGALEAGGPSSTVLSGLDDRAMCYNSRNANPTHRSGKHHTGVAIGMVGRGGGIESPRPV
jgi:hypothetical protein